MLQDYLWFIYALIAAMLWGMHYATAGELSKTLPPFFISMAYLIFLGISALGMLIFFRPLASDLKEFVSYLSWRNLAQLLVMVLTGGVSNFLVFSAIADSSATKASIIEITYPIFVALFAMFLYRENTLNLHTGIGGFFILVGVVFVMRS
jgi:drug/metabolite transporter (DMT)-like permease